jgi:hypothetical protein
MSDPLTIFEQVVTGNGGAGLPGFECDDGRLVSELVTVVVLEAGGGEAFGDEQPSLGVAALAGHGRAAGGLAGREVH